MEHPQPAFDLLTSLPIESTPEETIFVDWYARSDLDAEKGDKITDHPEVWEFLEFPDPLAELSTDDFVCAQPYSGSVNLNAVAIGLGLSNIKYEPEVFAGLVYNLSDEDGTVFLFPSEIAFTISGAEKDGINALGKLFGRLDDLGLGEDLQLDSDLQSGPVSDFIQ